MVNTDKIEKDKNKGASIVVNGEAKQVNSRDVSFEEVTQLAFPGSDPSVTTFTVLFYKSEGKKNGNSSHEGSMVEGDVVKVRKEGSSFNVTRSIRS